MKIQNTTKATVLNKFSRQGRNDPTKTYYSLVIMQECDAGTISCSKEVFDTVKEGENVIFLTEYNEEYKSFRILGVGIQANNK